jgi:rRNA processing protein Krr1/Pno1
MKKTSVYIFSEGEKITYLGKKKNIIEAKELINDLSKS